MNLIHAYLHDESKHCPTMFRVLQKTPIDAVKTKNILQKISFDQTLQNCADLEKF